MRYYLSIEKNVDSFESYRAMWNERGADGIIVGSMTEGIAKAIEIEKSKADGLYFIDIIADEIDFLPQLKILSEETNAPILVATYHFSEEQHLDVLNNGADFYAQLSKEPKKNIDGVLAVINSISQRAKKRKAPNRIIAHGDILILLDHHAAFVKDKELSLTGTEMTILRYLMANRGIVLSHRQICRKLYDGEYDEASSSNLYNAMKRLRKKIRDTAQADYIETVRDVGYRLVTKCDEII